MNQSISEEYVENKCSKLDQLYNEYPSPTLPFGILEDNWNHFSVDKDNRTIVPDHRFDDPFLTFLSEQMGGFEGKRILELGPLEGFHTHTFCQMGAKDVLGIEGNPRNFLKCLIVKNHYKMDAARFLVGDFTQYLEQEPDVRFSFIHAAGVLYHLARPMVLLEQVMQKTNAFSICTTLYDPENQTFRMTGVTREFVLEGAEPFVLHERLNHAGVTLNKKHGLEESAWLISRKDLLRFIDFCGFDYKIFAAAKPKTGATRIRLFARKRE